jgi:hypothetical protein
MRKGVGVIIGGQLGKLKIYTDLSGMVIRNGLGRKENIKRKHKEGGETGTWFTRQTDDMAVIATRLENQGSQKHDLRIGHLLRFSSSKMVQLP